MKHPKLSPGRGAQKTQPPTELKLAAPARTVPTDQRGSDPYNTSGTFDRKKHWERVGKR